MTLRVRFEGALDEWNRSVAELNGAITAFMNDGMQTRSGTWILTMNQSKSECLRAARRRETLARAALARIIDDLHRLDGDEVTLASASRMSAGSRAGPQAPEAAH